MGSRASLSALGLTPADPLAMLRREEDMSRPGKEAAALLQFLEGRRASMPMARDLAAGMIQTGFSPLGLSSFFLRHPSFIGWMEPPANQHSNRLAQALHLAAQVNEAHGIHMRRPGLLRVAWHVLVDLLRLPVRLFFSHRIQ